MNKRHYSGLFSVLHEVLRCDVLVINSIGGTDIIDVICDTYRFLAFANCI